MTALKEYLEDLGKSVREAEAAEAKERREAAARIAPLERERAFAHRRANLMYAVAESVQSAANEPKAVEEAQSILRARLGWASDSAARAEVVNQYAEVARAVYHSNAPRPSDFSAVPPYTAESELPSASDVAGQLAAFERWYVQRHSTSFWALFERELPETPLVDF